MESPGDSDHCWNDDSWEWILYPFPFQLHFGGWICWSIFHLFSIYGKSLILRWMGWSFILHPALDWKLWHWLVVWNIFPYIGNNNHPNWLSYFQRGRYTTNQDTKQIPTNTWRTKTEGWSQRELRKTCPRCCRNLFETCYSIDTCRYGWKWYLRYHSSCDGYRFQKMTSLACGSIGRSSEPAMFNEVKFVSRRIGRRAIWNEWCGIRCGMVNLMYDVLFCMSILNPNHIHVYNTHT